MAANSSMFNLFSSQFRKRYTYKLSFHHVLSEFIGDYLECLSPQPSLNGVEIERVGLDCETKWFKFLGMCLDDKFSWAGQCAHVYQKAVAVTFMLACLNITLPCRIRMLIYNSLV